MGSFVFPFALAEQAVIGIEDLATQLRVAVSTHEQALVIARHDFAGVTRQQFDLDVSVALDSLRSFASMLAGDADALRDTIGVARWLDSLDEDRP